MNTQPTDTTGEGYRASSTDRYEETAGSITAHEKRRLSRVWAIREQLEPCIIAVEDEIAACSLDLREPRVLRGERGRFVGLGEVENEIEKGGHGAGRKGLDSRHGDCGRRSVGGEGNRCAGANEAVMPSALVVTGIRGVCRTSA